MNSTLIQYRAAVLVAEEGATSQGCTRRCSNGHCQHPSVISVSSSAATSRYGALDGFAMCGGALRRLLVPWIDEQSDQAAHALHVRRRRPELGSELVAGETGRKEHQIEIDG